MAEYLTLREAAAKLRVTYDHMKHLYPLMAAAGLPVYELPPTRNLPSTNNPKKHKRIREDHLDAFMERYQIVQDYRGSAPLDNGPVTGAATSRLSQTRP